MTGFAHNGNFYRVAAAHPVICEFDLGFMEKFADVKVDHFESRANHRLRFKISSSAGQSWTIDVAESDSSSDFG